MFAGARAREDGWGGGRGVGARRRASPPTGSLTAVGLGGEQLTPSQTAVTAGPQVARAAHVKHRLLSSSRDLRCTGSGNRGKPQVKAKARGKTGRPFKLPGSVYSVLVCSLPYI